MSQNPVSILFVNDGCEDCYLLSKAFDESGDGNRLLIVENGDDFLNYLKGRGIYADRENYPLPSFILLDLDTPIKTDGEALVDIKNDPELRRIPIIVLDKLNDGNDVQETYGLDITGFIKKPMTFSGLVSVMKIVGNYWFQTAVLPSR